MGRRIKRGVPALVVNKRRKSEASKVESDKEVGTVTDEQNSSGSRLVLEHPLLNPLVLGIILNHMYPSCSELKIFRQVCRVWREESLKKWRECAVLTIIPDRRLPPTTREQDQKGVPLSQFLDLYQDPESVYNFSGKPFSKYQLQKFQIGNQFIRGEGGKQFHEFRNRIGPLITYLHLNECTILRRITLPLSNLLYWNFPNVKDLVLSDAKFKAPISLTNRISNLTPTRISKCLTTGLKLKTLTLFGDVHFETYCDLLVTAPNLQPSSARNGDLNQANLHILPAIRYTRIFRGAGYRASNSDFKLKHLDLFDSCAFSKCSDLDQMCEQLAGKNLNLESLFVQLRPNEKRLALFGNPPGNLHGSIDPFLHSISRTLKVLKIFRAPVGAPLARFLEYSHLNALAELHLIGTIAPNFKFFNRTPNLKKLRIDLACFEHQKRITKLIEENGTKVGKYQKYPFDMALFANSHLMEGVLLEKLEYLEIDFEFKDVGSIELLAKWMPNLTTLKTILNDATFSAACQRWGRNLTELVCMFGSTLHNHTLCKNVAHLTSVQTFRLEAYCSQAKLSDKSVKRGFLQMADLLSLNIYVDGKMSDKAEKALRNGVKFCQMIRPCKSSGGDPSKRYECCERTKFLAENGQERGTCLVVCRCANN